MRGLEVDGLVDTGGLIANAVCSQRSADSVVVNSYSLSALSFNALSVAGFVTTE